jgi:hypothetical protein
MGNITFKIEGEASSVIAAYRQLHESQKKSEDATKSHAQSHQNMVQQGLSGLQSMVTGWVGVQAIVQAVIGSLKEAGRVMDAAAEKSKLYAQAGGQLAQLAIGAKDPKAEMTRLQAAVNQAYAVGTFQNRQQAEGMVFQLASQGALAETNFFARLGKIDDPTALAIKAAALRQAMGTKETGSLRGVVSKAMAGAATAPGVGASDILGGAVGGASYAKMLGLSDEDLLAAVSLLAQKTGSGEAAGSQVSALLKAFVKKEVKGRNLQEMISTLAAKKMAPEDLMKFLGNRGEAAAAFTTLSGTDVAGRSAAIGRSAEFGGIAEQAIGLAEGADELAAATGRRAAEAQSEIALEPRGRLVNLVESLHERRLTALRGAGYPEAMLQLGEAGRAASKWIGGEAALRHEVEAGQWEYADPRAQLGQYMTAEERALYERLIAALDRNTSAQTGQTQPAMPAGE